MGSIRFTALAETGVNMGTMGHLLDSMATVLPSPVKDPSGSYTFTGTDGVKLTLTGDFNKKFTKGTIESVRLETSTLLASATDLDISLKSFNELVSAVGVDDWFWGLGLLSTKIIGTEHDDTLSSIANAQIFGFEGDDTMSGIGRIRFKGGDDIDTVTYVDASAGLTASLENRRLNTGEASGDVFEAVENLTGTGHDDTLIGQSGINTLDGGDGNDILEGREAGDQLKGGNGLDLASYRTSTQGVLASLANQALNSRDAEGDSYTDIEGLIGSASTDWLQGDADNNTIIGEGGEDLIIGGEGNNDLWGDFKEGGTNSADTFLVDAPVLIEDFGFGIFVFSNGLQIVHDFDSADQITISREALGVSEDYELINGLTFVFGDAAVSEHWTILFNQTDPDGSGQLMFDADGATRFDPIFLVAGLADPVVIAEIHTEGGYQLHLDDFVLV